MGITSTVESLDPPIGCGAGDGGGGRPSVRAPFIARRCLPLVSRIHFAAAVARSAGDCALSSAVPYSSVSRCRRPGAAARASRRDPGVGDQACLRISSRGQIPAERRPLDPKGRRGGHCVIIGTGRLRTAANARWLTTCSRGLRGMTGEPVELDGTEAVTVLAALVETTSGRWPTRPRRITRLLVRLDIAGHHPHMATDRTWPAPARSRRPPPTGSARKSWANAATAI